MGMASLGPYTRKVKIGRKRFARNKSGIAPAAKPLNIRGGTFARKLVDKYAIRPI
jgi:hypothetical protein